MKSQFLFLSATSLALLAVACNRPAASSISEESQAASSVSEATQETLDVSDASGAAAAFAPQALSAGSNLVAGCTATKSVLATASACGVAYNSSVSVTWSCTGPNGGTSEGTANVATAVTPDACPATQYSVSQTIGFNRTRTYQQLVGTLDGTATVAWSVAPGAGVATKQVTLDLDHKVKKDGSLVRHQTLAGNKTVDFAANGAGPADDTRIANGALDVKFLLAGDELNVTETNLTFHSDCCYPVAGTLSFVKSGNATGSGSATFGPSCGAAVNEAGDSLDLAPCDAQN
jgi:hypothetical protein